MCNTFSSNGWLNFSAFDRKVFLLFENQIFTFCGIVINSMYTAYHIGIYRYCVAIHGDQFIMTMKSISPYHMSFAYRFFLQSVNLRTILILIRHNLLKFAVQRIIKSEKKRNFMMILNEKTFFFFLLECNLQEQKFNGLVIIRYRNCMVCVPRLVFSTTFNVERTIKVEVNTP